MVVDRNDQPGGHWTTAYPFVRLHQPSAYYGVNSRNLGSDTIDQSGLNAGYYELASGAEVCAYFDAVMNQHLLPTGRVTYLPMSEYLGDGRDPHPRRRGHRGEHATRGHQPHGDHRAVDASHRPMTSPPVSNACRPTTCRASAKPGTAM